MRRSSWLVVERVKQEWILLLILAALACLKIGYETGVGPYGLDAGFYFQLARNVSQGEGVVSNVSLYHEGLATFPQRVMIYPLWPLVLGGIGGLIGLYRAAEMLPELLYLLDLVLLYLLSNRISVRLSGTSSLWQIKRVPRSTWGTHSFSC